MKKILLSFLLLVLSINIIYGQEFNEVAKITASDREALDKFGTSVSISGNFALIGAPEEDDDTLGLNSIWNAGAAYIYEKDSNGIWKEVQKIIPSDRNNGGSGDRFGSSVSISGNFALVGAYLDGNDSIGGFNIIGNAGSAYIFERNVNGTWNQVQKLVASDRANLDQFGEFLNISGNYAIIGTTSNSTDSLGLNNISYAGAAYIFERDINGYWKEVKKIVPSERGSNDEFGSSVSISGNYALVGAKSNNYDVGGGNFLNTSGAAFFFKRDMNGNWYETQKIVASDRDFDDKFGSSNDISGNYAIVGAPYEDHDTSGNNHIYWSGSAYLFQKDSNDNWNEVQKIVASDRSSLDKFAYSVSISSNRFVIGAWSEDHDENGNNTLPLSGSAYIYERDTNGFWNEIKKIVASDRNTDDRFGYSVDIYDEYIISGAFGEDEDSLNVNTLATSGSAYLFEYGPCQSDSGTQIISSCDSLRWINGQVYYNSNNTATWVQQNSNGCDSVFTLNLTITGSTTFNENIEICQGDSILLEGFFQTTNGVYYDSLQTVNGCDSLLATTLTVNSLPSVNLASFNPDTLCDNASAVTLPNGSPIGGSYSGNGIIGSDFNPNTAGLGTHDIIYTYTDTNSCTNSDTTIITVDACTGIDNINTVFGIIIYPNPSLRKFTIEKPNDLNKEVQIKLLDATSKLILEKVSPIGKQKVDMDIRNYSKGIYYLQLIVDGEVFVKQILKN